MIKNSFTSLFVLLIFSLGYLREMTFLVINSVYNNTPAPYNTAYITPPEFLYHLTTNTLMNLKWGLTLLFSIVFGLSTLLLVHYYFKNKQFNKIIILVYSSLIVVSTLISVFGIIFHYFETVYTISRFLIGLVQSPLISLVLFVLFYFKSKNHDYI